MKVMWLEVLQCCENWKYWDHFISCHKNHVIEVSVVPSSNHVEMYKALYIKQLEITTEAHRMLCEFTATHCSACVDMCVSISEVC